MSSPEIILMPDAEQLLCDWLEPALTNVGHPAEVGTRVPSPRPAAFVRVIRTGGPRGDLFVTDHPQLTFEAWAATESAAATLIGYVRALVNSMPGQVIGGVMVYRVDELSGPGNLPDPDSGAVRYTFSASILLRGSAL